jgi:hypothetical protein
MTQAAGLFAAPVSALRAALFARGLYALLAADCWVEMLGHAGRYGVDGFNVAHFAWLDFLLPLPSAALYVCLLVCVGVLCAFCAAGPHIPFLRGAIAGLYTFAWAISLHDAYQHHYLISWLLLAAALIPPAQLRGGAYPSGTTYAPGVSFACISCAIVYGFTAVSKLSPEWRAGDVLRTLTASRPAGASAPGQLDTLRDGLMGFGLAEGAFWRGLALGVVLLQGVVALAYLASLGRDGGKPGRVRRLLLRSGLLAAWLFHLTAVVSGVFAIGWFSQYMLFVASVLLLDRAWLERVAGVLLRAPRRRRALLVPAGLAHAVLGGLVGLAFFVLSLSHVPGACPGLLAALLLTAPAVFFAASPPRAIWAANAALAALLAAFSLSSVAFDYHRRLAGELLKLGRPADALASYREAERVAPHGHSRQGKIRALERALHEGTPVVPDE